MPVGSKSRPTDLFNSVSKVCSPGMGAECRMRVSVVFLIAFLSPCYTVSEDRGEVHHSEEPFTNVKEYLLELEIKDLESNIDTSGNITYDSTVKLVNGLLDRFGCPGKLGTGVVCQECAENITDHVYRTVGAEVSRGLSEETFYQSTVVLLYMFSTCDDIFKVCNSGVDSLERIDAYTDGLLGPDGLLAEEELDDLLDELSHKYHSSSNYKCFDVETVFEAEVTDHEHGATDAELLHISPLIITKLLQGYCIGTPNQTDPQSFRDDIFNKYGHDGLISEEHFEEMLVLLSIGGSTEGGASQDSHNHAKRSVKSPNRLMRRAVLDDHGHVVKNSSEAESVTTKCFTGEQLLQIFGIDHEAGISEEQFTEICPAFVQQVLSEACLSTHEATNDTPSTLVWLYGTIAVLIISLGSLVGGLFIPCMSPSVYEKFVHSLIALAIAVLIGDAIIHLLPLALGVHGHEESSPVVHSPFDPELAFAWKSLLTVVAIYAFYLLETVLGWISGHKHSHATEMNMEPSAAVITKRESQAELTKSMNAVDHDFPNRGKSLITKYGALPVMVLIGDSLHNFADGLAVGAAFTAGVGPGISTSLAVLCHEVPHELGDLAILLKAGVKLKWALCLNFLTALTAFGGLYLGIALATTDIARQWIFAVTAGMFLYVALADMMPQITNLQNVKDPGLTFVLQNIFFLLGLGFIFVIALYEDAINIQF